MSKRQREEDGLIPVTLVTGFLGAGKTTLLNHILQSKDHGYKFAIIENEFGDVGVDDGVLKESSEDSIVEMMNGCVCCTVRSDLVKVLKQLASERFKKFDAVIIETTGMADPAPVAQTFFVDEDIEQLYSLDGILTVVDAKHALQHLNEVKPEGVENESVEQIAFADRILLNKIDLVDESELAAVEKKIKSINKEVQILRTTQSKVDPSKLLGIEAFSLDRVVKMDPEFLDTDGEHEHDKSISSVSFKFEGDVNSHTLHRWIQTLLAEKGPDLFRHKGILSVKGMPRKFVFQGVHMLVTAGYNPDFVWGPDEKRECKFVFIGRNLDHDALKAGFEACKVTKPLRFNIGDKVLARRGEGYVPGVVTRIWENGCPYEIDLTNTDIAVWGLEDTDDFVKIDDRFKAGK